MGKNVESSYEAMLKLRRDLSRAVTMLEMVKRREKTKKEKLNLTLDIFDKRFQMSDWEGKGLEYANQVKPKAANTFNIQSWMNLASPPAKRSYRRRKRLRSTSGRPEKALLLDRVQHSSEDENVQVNSEEETEESPFVFRRKEGVQYHSPLEDFGNNNNTLKEISILPEAGPFTMTAISNNRCMGFCRRRIGRGGRLVLDRLSSKWDNQWTFAEGVDWNHSEGVVRPLTPPAVEEVFWDPYIGRGGQESGGSSFKETTLTQLPFRMVDMNKAGAHNAARALVNSQFVDLFSISQSS